MVHFKTRNETKQSNPADLQSASLRRKALFAKWLPAVTICDSRRLLENGRSAAHPMRLRVNIPPKSQLLNSSKRSRCRLWSLSLEQQREAVDTNAAHIWNIVRGTRQRPLSTSCRLSANKVIGLPRGTSNDALLSIRCRVNCTCTARLQSSE